MKSRPKARDTSKADKLINGAGDDPEVADQATSISPVDERKPNKKLGKSHPDNQDYHKMMLYIQSDIRAALAEQAFRSKDMDMSDIVNQLLADKLDVAFIDPSS